jgi:hypothetical protein
MTPNLELTYFRDTDLLLRELISSTDILHIFVNFIFIKLLHNIEEKYFSFCFVVY